MHGVVLLLALSIIQGAVPLNCPAGEYPFYIPDGRYTLIITQFTGNDATIQKDSTKACQEACDSETRYECKSFSFSAVTEECKLYPLLKNEAGVNEQTSSNFQYYRGTCSRTPNLKECKTTGSMVDLAFVVDGSGSICDTDTSKNLSDPINTCNNWIQVKNFIGQIVQLLNIGPNNTRVALITFANEATLVFDLKSDASITQLIQNARYPGGNTNTYAGLHMMRTEVFRNDRKSAGRLKIGFVITDGKATRNIGSLNSEAEQCWDDGIITYAVGITKSIDEQSLKNLSSPPQKLNKNYFRSQNFNDLYPIVNSLLSSSCIRLNPRFTVSTTQPPPASTEEFLNHPGYIVLIILGTVIVVLFFIAILLLCYY